MRKTKTFRKGSLYVVLDRSQVFPDDPGAGTPAMVEYRGAYWGSATYWCAVGEGELDRGRHGMMALSDSALEWLESLEDEIEAFLYGEE